MRETTESVQAGEEGASVAPDAALSKEPKKKRTPRVDWAQLLRRTFGLDVFTCAGCGGKRRVLAYLTAPNAVRTILEHLSLPTRPHQGLRRVFMARHYGSRA